MKKEEELKVRISPEDKARIRSKMEEAGILNMSAYVRKMALDGICVKLDLADVRQLIVLLQRCSTNLNQYAKRANETGSVYAADIEDLRSPAKRKTGNPVLAAIIGLRQDWQGIVWTIPKSHPGVSANLQCPPHRCSRFRSPALRTGSDYRSIAGA